MPEACPVYRPRKPHLTPHYQCVQDHFETLEQLWPERFEKHFGFWRPYLKEVMLRYLACGDLHAGFARLVCQGCGRNFLLAYSCKRRYFCPSCHQKRAVEFGEWLCGHVLKAVPHRHLVFSIPKLLRRFFLRDRKLLADLSACAWEALKTFLQAAVPEPGCCPGGIVATQTFRDLPHRYHPHLHVLATDGCFYMEYLPQEAKVLYQSKDGNEKKTCSALEWLAAMGTHVPDRYQQCVRYYGAYANSTRGQAAQTATGRPHPHRAGAADLFGTVSQELGTPDPEGL